MQLKKKAAQLAAVTAVACATLAGFAVQDGPRARAQDSALNPADFSTTIDNPLFPLSELEFKRFLGEEIDADTGEVVETKLETYALAYW